MGINLKTICLPAALAYFIVSATAFARPYLYVENAISGDISVISIPEHEVVSLISVGAHPDDVIGSADGKTVFVNRGVVQDHTWDVPEAGEIVAISTETDEIKWRLPIEEGWPHHMSISRDGVLYAPLFNQAHIVVIDTTVPRIIGRIDGHYGMHGTRLSADEKRLYAGSILTRAAYVIDVEENKPVKIINFKEGVRPFTFTEDEAVLYAQQSGLHGFEVVDLHRGEVVKTVHLPEAPDTLEVPDQWPHNANHGLELSPDEQYVFAAGSIRDYVVVYTHPDLELVEIISVGKDPNWIVFSPNGKYAYVGCNGSHEVSIISVDEMKEIKRMKTGGRGTKRLRVVDVPSRRVD
jgi:DNA-binding beta-propeller fold protein YncE